MELSESELQSRVEKIVESYLLKNNRKLHNQSSFHSESKVDLELDLIKKQIERQNLLGSVLQSVNDLVQRHSDSHRKEIEKSLERMEEEIVKLKQLVLASMSDSSLRTNLKMEVTMSDDQSGTNDSFLLDDGQLGYHQKLKSLKEKFKKKTKQIDNMLNIVLEQQVTFKSQLSEIPHGLTKIQDNVQTKIEQQMNEYLDQKYQAIKKIVEEVKNKDKDKINLLWGIVTECKADVEALQKLFNEKTPKNLLSRLGLK